MSEELERAVEEVKALVVAFGSSTHYDDLRHILSERAELLAAVERMRGALDGINELVCDRLALIPPDLVHGGVLGELLLEILARAALTTGEATSPHPAPIKPSGDTGELRDDILERLRSLDFADHYDEARFQYIADTILDLIQSEKVGSPIGQNDQPGLA